MSVKGKNKFYFRNIELLEFSTSAHEWKPIDIINY